MELDLFSLIFFIIGASLIIIVIFNFILMCLSFIFSHFFTTKRFDKLFPHIPLNPKYKFTLRSFYYSRFITFKNTTKKMTYNEDFGDYDFRKNSPFPIVILAFLYVYSTILFSTSSMLLVIWRLVLKSL